MPGAGPDPGRFTCSLIRERGGEGAGLGVEAACRDWPSPRASREVAGEALLPPPRQPVGLRRCAAHGRGG